MTQREKGSRADGARNANRTGKARTATMAGTATTSGTTIDAETAERAKHWLRQMLLIRRFEERAGEAYSLGKIGGFCHLYIGQEAVAVGTMAALREDDYITASYREHGQALARGLSARECMAELFGKATGCSGGKGGSMHLFDASKGFLGGHGIVGGHIPLTAGMAFAIKYRGGDQVAVCYFGEAAVNIGAFHEALNMASLWKLPAIFIIENNRYGMGTAVTRASAVQDVGERAGAYGMVSEAVDGQDVTAVFEAMQRAVERARTKSEPTLLEVRTYRFMGHSMSDAISGTYRTKEELEDERKRDPIATWSQRLIAEGVMTEEEIRAMDAEVQAEVEDAVKFADESPEPEPEALFRDVYAPTEEDR
jgi:pyruvate dehydrogenase E1 component alpha subunit